MKTAALIFPHQLFDPHPVDDHSPARVDLVEDTLFFGDSRYPAKFHKQKLWLHRASMKRFASNRQQGDAKVHYHAYAADQDPLRQALERIKRARIKSVLACDPHDFMLHKRTTRHAEELGLQLEWLETPGFLNTPEQNHEYRSGKKRWFMADFYQFHRRRLKVLMDGDDPEGGQWSFDADNRKKVPKKELSSIPELRFSKPDDIDQQARESILKQFPDHYGNLDHLIYPTSHDEAAMWLNAFLKQRLEKFGVYEDAIVEGESWLWHGVLTPMLNIGLLTPKQIVDRTLAHAKKQDVPLNSLEGFLRQVIGWREFMRATYEDLGVKMRTSNHWGHHRRIPESFWNGTTGIDPVDDVIRRLQETAYCHHIERLMVLGGFMFLCEFDPDEIYRWFMEMFIDSYDWVMVPNAYAMSQNADGGLITTKPYFSGSSYIKKMSHFKHGQWADTWDGLYWRWVDVHRVSLAKNPRWAMMCKMAEKMDTEKMRTHHRNAEAFLETLD
ncbi:MAG: cryptochrome/photolyase family protein [Planctomycetota bacterium]